MSLEDYRGALKLGEREYRSCMVGGRYPYLQVLDEVLNFAETRGEEDLGLVNIPVERIVGTKTGGRRSAFAANFMPLLDEDSEFAHKWVKLADAHLEEGIRDPVTAYEYMNRFYILEGNKRVSVLKYFGALSIPATVRRVLPQRQDTPESRIYFDFLEFYRLTGVNYVWFSQPGRFKRLLLAVKGSEVRWTAEERRTFSAVYDRFRRTFKTVGGDKLPGTTGDAFLAFVKLHSYAAVEGFQEDRLWQELARGWNELAAYSIPQPVELALDPAGEDRGKSLLTKLWLAKYDKLEALFLYERSPDTSAWTHAHDEGRKAAEAALGDRVVTRFEANVHPDRVTEAIDRGVKAGAEVVFTASPKLLPGCLKAAVEHPEVKMLNCSVYSPHPSIRTYYGRMYEVKVLAGAIAGAMSHTHKIGYIADYPIYGTMAAINAFALGVRMTDPWAQVFVEWRCQGEAGLWERLTVHGVDMLSGQDVRSPVDPWRAYGLYQVTDGVGRQIAAAQWNWGRFYERILRNILDGNWKQPPDRERHKAINYWWGLSAGVVDFTYSDDIPTDTMRLVRLLRDGLVSGQFQPFTGRITAQGGRVIQEDGALTAEEIVKMDWLAENVVGVIPGMDEIAWEAQELYKVQGLWREDTP